MSGVWSVFLLSGILLCVIGIPIAVIDYFKRCKYGKDSVSFVCKCPPANNNNDLIGFPNW